jgi:putative transposase
MVKRRRHSAKFKFQVALEAAKGTQTLSELASEYQLHPSQISAWKRALLDSGPDVLSTRRAREKREQATREAELYKQIGRLKMELEWLKKKLPDSIEGKRMMVDPQHPELSIRRQCELLGLSRATYYYVPAQETPLNLKLMRLIDEQYLKTPFYGYRRMAAQLRRRGYTVNPKRVRRLMRLLGLEAVGPRPNQVWSTDITYLPLARGFMYLVAVMDWYSRYVLSWQLSNTLDGRFCREALEAALGHGKPEIFNTDQGAQFTAHKFTARLVDAGIRVSMDGRGRALDNVFVERLWRSVKYEDVYIRDYATVPDLTAGLDRYFTFYNHERPHQSLDYEVPATVHLGAVELALC